MLNIVVADPFNRELKQPLQRKQQHPKTILVYELEKTTALDEHHAI